jgi:hypothetical protein
MEAYVEAQTTADEAYTAVVYSDGYTLATQIRAVADENEINLVALCIDGTSPETETDLDDGFPFATCNVWDVSEYYSYTDAALMTAVADTHPTDYDVVTESDDFGYNMSWVCAFEDITTDEQTVDSLESVSFTCARFLPSLGEEGEYDTADLRFDSDTVGGRICYFKETQNFDPTIDCVDTVDEDGEAFWAGAATVYAGAVVAIAATLF